LLDLTGETLLVEIRDVEMVVVGGVLVADTDDAESLRI